MEASPPASTRAALEPKAGVLVLDLACDAGGAERCDGVDNNCDGAIDEGCGVALGPLQITATWLGPADVDLVVTGPDGAAVPKIHFDRRSGCDHRGPAPAIENAHWQRAPEPGRYHIVLTRAARCGDESQPETVASVSVAFSGKSLGTLNRTLRAGEQIPVADLVLSP